MLYYRQFSMSESAARIIEPSIPPAPERKEPPTLPKQERKGPPPLPTGAAKDHIRLASSNPNPEQAFDRIAEQERNISRQKLEAQIEALNANVHLIAAKRIKGIHEEQDWKTVLDLRKAEIELMEMIDELRAEDDADANSALIEKAARAQKAAREALDLVHLDAKEGADDEDWDYEGAAVDDAELIPPDVVKPGALNVAAENDAHRHPKAESLLRKQEAMLKAQDDLEGISNTELAESVDPFFAKRAAEENERTEPAKKDFHGATDAEIEQDIEKAFAPYVAEEERQGRADFADITKEELEDAGEHLFEVEIAEDRMRAKRAKEDLERAIQARNTFDPEIQASLDQTFPESQEHRRLLMDIPATLEATQKKTDALDSYLNEVQRTIDMGHVNNLIFRSIQDDLQTSFRAPLEERLHLIQLSPARSEDAQAEAAIIAEALHRIEDTKHALAKTQLKPLERPQADRLGSKNAVDPSLESQLKLKTKLRDALVMISEDLVQALEKAGMKNPELEMTTYTQPGILSGLKRLFTSPASRIDAKTFQRITRSLRDAQIKFNTAYYDAYEQAQNVKERGTLGGNMPIEHLGRDADLFAVWKAIHEEISALSKDVEAPTVPEIQKGKGEGTKNAAIQNKINELRSREVEGTEMIARSAEVEAAKRAGISDAETILEEIQTDPHADQLTFHGQAYLNQMVAVMESIKASDQVQTAKELAILESMQEELLENGIPMTSGAQFIENANKLRYAQPRKSKEERAAKRAKKAEEMTRKKKYAAKKK